jgi:hypothetical protein
MRGRMGRSQRCCLLSPLHHDCKPVRLHHLILFFSGIAVQRISSYHTEASSVISALIWAHPGPGKDHQGMASPIHSCRTITPNSWTYQA